MRWIAMLVYCAASVLQAEEPVKSKWRTYAAGPLRREDFQVTPPDDLTEQESQHEAMIYGDLHFDYQYRTMNGVGQVTLYPTSIRIWAVMDSQKSWFLKEANRPVELLDHEQGHFDIFEIAARQLQQEFDAQVADDKLVVKARTEKEAVAKFKEKLQKRMEDTNKYLKQVGQEYDNLCMHGQKLTEQRELREVHRRHLKQLSAVRNQPRP